MALFKLSSASLDDAEPLLGRLLAGDSITMYRMTVHCTVGMRL